MRSEAFRWTRTFDQRELARLLADKAPGVGFLRSVAILERGPGGRVMGLRLTGTKGVKTILYELPIRRFFNNLRSGTFAIETTTNPQSTVAKLTFRGAGWGHGVGMCQMGAIGRAETGHPHQSILEHYYGNASLHQLYQTSSLD
jgi:SpoIID/LytB domain protein